MKAENFKAIQPHQKVREKERRKLFIMYIHVQQVNHLPGSFQIGRKDRLWRNLSKMQAHYGKRVSTTAKTYCYHYKF